MSGARPYAVGTHLNLAVGTQVWVIIEGLWIRKSNRAGSVRAEICGSQPECGGLRYHVRLDLGEGVESYMVYFDRVVPCSILDLMAEAAE